MKNCPTCKRTYEDDTLAFCLDDGARLSAAFAPRSSPGGRGAELPRTEILPPEMAPTPLRSTMTVLTPLPYPQEAQQGQATEKRGSKTWVVISGLLAFAVVGLVIVLGYLAWKVNNRSTSEPSSVSANPPTNSYVPVNASQKSEATASKNNESTPTEDTSFKLLDGVWEGEGYQSDTKTTWAARLTVQDGAYAIDYPNIPCGGRWTPTENNSNEGRFIETITQGANRCSNNSRITIQKVNDSEISCKYTRAHSRVVIATLVLTRKVQSSAKR